MFGDTIHRRPVTGSGRVQSATVCCPGGNGRIALERRSSNSTAATCLGEGQSGIVIIMVTVSILARVAELGGIAW